MNDYSSQESSPVIFPESTGSDNECAADCADDFGDTAGWESAWIDVGGEG